MRLGDGVLERPAAAGSGRLAGVRRGVLIACWREPGVRRYRSLAEADRYREAALRHSDAAGLERTRKR